VSTADPVRDLPVSPRRKSAATRPATAHCYWRRRGGWSPNGAQTRSPWTTSPRAAGVGKGTVFRRFGSRAGLMMVLLDEDERINQQAFMFGPCAAGS